MAYLLNLISCRLILFEIYKISKAFGVHTLKFNYKI